MSYYRGMTTQVVSITGYQGDKGEAYYARPEGNGPFGAVVLIHHMPGWDNWTMEAVRKLAHQGLIGIAPNLYQVVGDVEGALAFLRAQKEFNGKVGVMGFCSGGRHAFICAGRIASMKAIVDCWGGSVIVDDPALLTPKRPINPIDYAKDIQCPILGIFGNEDKNPDRGCTQIARQDLFIPSL
jgi:carboxymethylenebutenolidase